MDKININLSGDKEGETIKITTNTDGSLMLKTKITINENNLNKLQKAFNMADIQTNISLVSKTESVLNLENVDVNSLKQLINVDEQKINERKEENIQEVKREAVFTKNGVTMKFDNTVVKREDNPPPKTVTSNMAKINSETSKILEAINPFN